jgi:dynein heavy chain
MMLPEANASAACILMFQIKVYKQFRMWKGFYVWRKYCIWKKFCIAQEALKQNLFVLNPILQQALLSIQAMCCKLMDTSFTDVSKMEGNALSEFMEVQVCFNTGFLVLNYLYIMWRGA